jgi:hypothetical protein
VRDAAWTLDEAVCKSLREVSEALLLRFHRLPVMQSPWIGNCRVPTLDT